MKSKTYFLVLEEGTSRLICGVCDGKYYYISSNDTKVSASSTVWIYLALPFLVMFLHAIDKQTALIFTLLPFSRLVVALVAILFGTVLGCLWAKKTLATICARVSQHKNDSCYIEEKNCLATRRLSAYYRLKLKR
jgi:hypothetical protein